MSKVNWHQAIRDGSFCVTDLTLQSSAIQKQIKRVQRTNCPEIIIIIHNCHLCAGCWCQRHNIPKSSLTTNLLTSTEKIIQGPAWTLKHVRIILKNISDKCLGRQPVAYFNKLHIIGTCITIGLKQQTTGPKSFGKIIVCVIARLLLDCAFIVWNTVVN